MKNKLIIIVLFAFIAVLTGCTNKDPELEKLKTYLENSQFYNCKKDICQKEENTGNIEKIYDYNFEKNTHTTVITIGTNNTIKYEYNWKNDKTVVTSTNLDITINATYDFFTNKYDCLSNSASDAHITSECEKIKSNITEEKDKIIANFNNSGSKYYIAN